MEQFECENCGSYTPTAVSNAFDSYQIATLETAVYPGAGQGEWLYPTLGLAAEAGEVLGKLSKIVRGDYASERLGSQGTGPGEPICAPLRQQLTAELGDTLWMLARLADELGLRLSDIARANLAKLAARAATGTLKGSGDVR